MICFHQSRRDQFLCNLREVPHGHADTVADGDEIVRPVRIRDEIRHRLDFVVAAFLTDGRIEASFAKLRLAKTLNFIGLVRFERLDAFLIDLIRALEAARGDEAEVVFARVVLGIFAVLAAADGADGEVEAWRVVLTFIRTSVEECATLVFRIVEPQDVLRDTIGERIAIA